MFYIRTKSQKMEFMRLFRYTSRIVFLFAVLLFTMGGAAGSPVHKDQPLATQKQYQAPVLINKKDNPVLKITVEIPQSTGHVRLEAIRLSTVGTTSINEIEAVRVYYYGGDSVMSTSNDMTRPLFGKSIAHGEEIQIAGKRILAPGIHFLWVSYELSDDADLDHRVSARCLSVTVDGKAIAVVATGKPTSQRLGVAVRQHQQDGVHTARIPGLATTNNGTLLAVFDARHASARDLQGDIDIGLHRSTDNGQTWEPLQIAMDMGEWGGLPQKFNGVSDACILVDRNSNAIYIAGLWMHGVINEDGKWIEGLNEHSDDWNHQWRNKASQPGFGVRETSQFLIVKSTDDGKSWSKPINLTRMCKKEEWWLFAPAPGNGITLVDGTLVFPTQGRDEQGRPFSNITYSTDGGDTWKTSNPAYTGTTECAVVQLSDDRLMLNMRLNQNKGKLGSDNGRAVAVTDDLGISWAEHPSSSGALPEPVCMASLYKHSFRLNNGDHSMLLFSNPNSKQFRENLTVKISHNDGETWPETQWILLDEGRSRGYSSLTSVDDHHVGILYESSQADLVFQRIAISEYLGDPQPNSGKGKTRTAGEASSGLR